MSPILQVRFFATSSGAEPVREWLKTLSPADRKAIGEDIKTVQYGWPLGMPLVRKLDKDIWGGAHSPGWADCASNVYGGGWGDGVIAWFYQEIADHPERRLEFDKGQA